MKNNRIKVKLETAASFLGLAYENTTRLNKELKVKGWIEKDGNDTILLKGWTDENVSIDKAVESKTDENISFEAEKLTKTSVLETTDETKTDENISFDEEVAPKTDENISFEGKISDENLPEKPKTDENISLKLTKTSVGYKDEPASLNQQEEEKSISNEIRVRLSYLSASDEKKLKAEICTKPKIPPITEPEWNSVIEIFDDWKQVFGKNTNSRLTVKRARAVLDRLRSFNKYTVAEIKRAIRGCRASPNHNGTRADSAGVVYDDLELICRNDDQIEKMHGYLEAAQALKKGKKDNNGSYPNTNGTIHTGNAHLQPHRIGDR